LQQQEQEPTNVQVQDRTRRPCVVLRLAAPGEVLSVLVELGGLRADC